MSESRFDTPWISASGIVSLSECSAITEDFLKLHPDSRYVSFHTDHFSAGYAASVQEEFTENMLELRLFDSSAELRLFRTFLGGDFQYRIADDNILQKNLDALETEDSFLKDPAHYRHVVRQVLDIDTSAHAYQQNQLNSHGCRILRTVGGGNYALPLDGNEDIALVINYLSYDRETGVCNAVDSRIAGFEKWKGAKKDESVSDH